MKNFILLFSLILFSNFSFSIEIPTGGTNMIDDAISNHTKIGSAGTVTVVNVDHAEFDKAIRVNVTTRPENYYNFQVQFKTNMALEKGDICLVSVWARTTKSGSEAGEGTFAAVIEHNQTYSKPLNKAFSPGGDWTHFVYAFEASESLSLEYHKAALFLGFSVQTIEVGNVQFLNYKKTKTINDMPVMQVTYEGMSEDAAWRVSAAERIEKFRKGNVTIKLVDENNNPVSNANVNLEMKKHKFGFGSAIDGNTYLSNTTYRNKIHELFSEVVFENDLKWRPWVTRASNAYILSAIDNLTSNGINVRGHCMVWPGWNTLPTFLKAYENNAPRLKQECLDHIETVGNFTKGKLVDWDVMNEPYTNHVLQDICGDEIMADWFKKAKEVDPDVKRYINDYSIIGNGGVDVNHQDGYFDIIKYIDDNGGEIDGIGMQGHFAELVTGIPRVIEILDRFATFNKEIKITEFDINSINDELKVNYTRDFMTVLFSYPHVKSVMCWGFWEGRHWRPEAAYYNKNWTIRPQGEMYKSLVLDEWWTKMQNAVSAADGETNFGDCFLGNYDIEVSIGGVDFTIKVPVHFNKENNIVINVDDKSFSIEGEEHAETPVFTSAKNISEVKENELKIYPNPASTHLNIEFSGFQKEDFQVQVINVSGKSVVQKQMNLTQSNLLELPNLKSGLYFLSVQSNNQRFVERFVVR